MIRGIKVGASVLGGAVGFAIGYGSIALVESSNLHLDADSQEKILTAATGLGYSLGNCVITVNRMLHRL